MAASGLREGLRESFREGGGAGRVAARVAPPAPLSIETLFSMYVAFVWRSLRHLGVHKSDLDDQTQEVFIVAYRRLAECNGEQPQAWLYAIARRCAASYRRRSHRRHEHTVENMPQERDTRDPGARVELDLLYRALDALDDDKRAVFLLHEIEELPMREVAAAVHCTLPTAYARFYAARRELARVLEDKP